MKKLDVEDAEGVVRSYRSIQWSLKQMYLYIPTFIYTYPKQNKQQFYL